MIDSYMWRIWSSWWWCYEIKAKVSWSESLSDFEFIVWPKMCFSLFCYKKNEIMYAGANDLLWFLILNSPTNESSLVNTFRVSSLHISLIWDNFCHKTISKRMFFFVMLSYAEWNNKGKQFCLFLLKFFNILCLLYGMWWQELTIHVWMYESIEYKQQILQILRKYSVQLEKFCMFICILIAILMMLYDFVSFQCVLHCRNCCSTHFVCMRTYKL